MTKAIGREHKGKLQVVGALALTAAIVAGLVVAHKKIIEVFKIFSLFSNKLNILNTSIKNIQNKILAPTE